VRSGPCVRIPRVLIPALPGALSAVGILLADAVRDYSRTVMLASGADLEGVFLELESAASRNFAMKICRARRCEPSICAIEGRGMS